MADAQTIIVSLGQQLAQAIVDRTIAQVELAETQGRLAQALADVAASQAQVPESHAPNAGMMMPGGILDCDVDDLKRED